MRCACLLAALLLAPAASPRAEDPARAEGTLDDEDGTRVEVLSGKLPVGQRIELPEGWFRVEEEGVEDRRVGSFTVVSAGTEESSPASASAPPAPPQVPIAPRGSPAELAGTALAGRDTCRAERSAYLRQLWRESGIEVADPDALLRGLDAGTSGPAAGFYWFAMSTDAFRNLAWSSELRSRAKALIRCVSQDG
jgi:hypothetical protein